MLKNGVDRYNMFFFYLYTKLAESSFLCRFRVESVNVLVCAMSFFFNKQFRTWKKSILTACMPLRVHLRLRLRLTTFSETVAWYSSFNNNVLHKLNKIYIFFSCIIFLLRVKNKIRLEQRNGWPLILFITKFSQT
jgi:hypothetical protein